MIANKNALIEFFSHGKSLKYPEKLRENSGNLISQKCDHPVDTSLRKEAYKTTKGQKCKIYFIIHVFLKSYDQKFVPGSKLTPKKSR